MDFSQAVQGKEEVVDKKREQMDLYYKLMAK